MITALLVAFLVAHGLVHLAIWLPHPQPDTEKPPPFQPDHSGLLTAAPITPSATHTFSVVLASAVAIAYVLAGVAVATSVPAAAGLVAVAAGLGLVLKTLFFHPWLTVGVAIDAVLLVAAMSGWPVSLT
jgi:hypothetical protein